MTANVESMAWVGNRGLPWWIGTPQDVARLKTELEGLATGAEIREAAGLGWQVDKKEIYVGRKGMKIDGKYATVRSDTGAPLGVVGRGYQPVQNNELDAWGDALVDTGEAKYETAGSLAGGRVVFYSMELSGLDIKVRGMKAEDEVKTFLLLTNTHDGSKSMEALITMVRVVCVNTLNLATREARSSFRIRHVGSMEGKIAAARDALGITFTYMEGFKKLAEQLALKKVVDDQVYDILSKAVWPLAEDVTEGRREASHAQKAFELYLSSETVDPIRGTAWGVLNAVAEYTDWEIQPKSRGGQKTLQDIRAVSLLWGQAKQRKEAALEALLKI